MPAPKTPTTFDGHLGSIIADAARRKGGRPRVAELIGVSTKTIDRRALGDGSYTVKEVHIIADALNTTGLKLIEQALRDYAGGTVEDGVAKLIAAEGAVLVPEEEVSPAPVNIETHKKNKSASKTDYESEKRVAIKDDELEQDESPST